MRKYSEGTTFYEATLDDILSVLESDDANPWLIYALKSDGMDAIKIDDMFGSAIIDDVLYICVTDGRDIVVDGRRIDPEYALDNSMTQETVSELYSDYIVRASKDIIRERITEYEIEMRNTSDLAAWMLDDGIAFEDIVEYAREIDLIE